MIHTNNTSDKLLKQEARVYKTVTTVATATTTITTTTTTTIYHRHHCCRHHFTLTTTTTTHQHHCWRHHSYHHPIYFSQLSFRKRAMLCPRSGIFYRLHVLLSVPKHWSCLLQPKTRWQKQLIPTIHKYKLTQRDETQKN